ncbi:MAG: hypothetical protein FD168_1079 [Desulfobulbaceae bacterium]|nr:MAG: hypothetical protein FD168_1079 [Desulfobulbaceae bacterium]
MRIVIVAISFCEYLIQQANGLAALGHNVLLVMPSSLVQRTVGDDIGGLIAPGVECFANTEERPWKLAYYSNLIRAVSSFGPDLFHIHDNGEMSTLVLLLFFRAMPLVVTVHDVTTHPGADSQIKMRRRSIKRFLKSRAAVIHLHGKTLCMDFKKRYPRLAEKAAVVPHGTLSIFKYWDNKTIEQEATTCLFFGRMEKYRGLDNLLKIGEILKETVPGIKIIVAGRGPELEKNKAEMMISGIFEIHDSFIPNRDIPLYFRRASLLLLPYHEASQSGVVSMGFPFGTPIVATRVGSIPEVVLDGKHGVIVEPGDNPAFAEAVRDLLLNKPKLKQMSAHCLESAKMLDFDTLAVDFEGLYEKAIRRKNV